VNWDAIGALAELLGAFGVIATLGYLALQIRQNTTALRGNGHEVALEHLTAVLLTLSTNPNLAELVSKGSQDYASLSYDGRLQFGSYWASAFFGAEASLLQWRRGNLDEAVCHATFRRFVLGYVRQACGNGMSAIRSSSLRNSQQSWNAKRRWPHLMHNIFLQLTTDSWMCPNRLAFWRRDSCGMALIVSAAGLSRSPCR